MKPIKQLLYSLSKQSTSDLPYTVILIRAEAIARKALREGTEMKTIADRLVQEFDFKRVEQNFGRDKARELASYVITKAMKKERIKT